MSNENPDHYRFMPRAKGEENEEDTAPRQEEATPERETEETVTLIVEETQEEQYDKPGSAPSGATGSVAPAGTSAVSGNAEPWMDSIGMRLLYGFFSPLLVPTFVTLIIFLLTILAVVVPGGALPYSLTVFGATCLVPFIAIYILMRVGAVKDFLMLDPRERTIPYIIEFLALGGVALFFVFKGANPWMWSIYCGGAAVTLANFLINFRMRISCHCSAMAAMVAALIVINSYGLPQVSLFWWVVAIVFFAGYVGTVAIYYGRHTLWEVLAGYATGFLGVILFSLIH